MEPLTTTATSEYRSSSKDCFTSEEILLEKKKTTLSWKARYMGILKFK